MLELLVVITLFASNATGIIIGNKNWKAAEDVTADSSFLSSLLQTLPSDSKLNCAMKVSSISWGRLFCYKNEVCQVSDLIEPPLQNVTSTTFCHTISPELQGEWKQE